MKRGNRKWLNIVGFCLLAWCSACSQFIPPATTEPIQIENAKSLSLSAQAQTGGVSLLTWLPDGGVAGASANALLFLGQPTAKALGAPATLRQVSAAALNVQPLVLAAAPKDYLAWSSAEPAVHVWSVHQQQELYRLEQPAGPATSLTFDPTGEQLAAADAGGQVNIWSAADGKALQSWNTSGWLTNLSYSPDGQLLGGVSLGEFTVYIYNVRSGEQLITLQWVESASPALYGAYFALDWSQIAWVARGEVQLMHLPDGALGALLSHEDFVSALAWAPDSQLLATAAAATVEGSFAPAIFLWEAQSGQLVRLIPVPEAVSSLAFSPDGTALAYLTVSGGINILTVR